MGCGTSSTNSATRDWFHFSEFLLLVWTRTLVGLSCEPVKPHTHLPERGGYVCRLHVRSMRLASFAVCLLMIATPTVMATEPSVDQGSNCNNNGIVVQATVTGDNEYNCDAYIQYCDQGTGAGSGAGAGGPGQNDVGAEAGATGKCSQGSGDPSEDKQCVETQEKNRCAPSATSATSALIDITTE